MAWRKWALRPASAEVEVAAVKAAAVTTMANAPVIKDFDRIFIFISIGFHSGLAHSSRHLHVPLAAGLHGVSRREGNFGSGKSK